MRRSASSRLWLSWTCRTPARAWTVGNRIPDDPGSTGGGLYGSVVPENPGGRFLQSPKQTYHFWTFEDTIFFHPEIFHFSEINFDFSRKPRSHNNPVGRIHQRVAINTAVWPSSPSPFSKSWTCAATHWGRWAAGV